MPITPEDLARFRRMQADGPPPLNPKAHPNWDPDGNEPDAAGRAAIEKRKAEARAGKEREAAGDDAAPKRTCPECGGPLAAKKDRCYRCCPGGRNPAPPSYATVLDALRVVAVALAPLRPADRRRVLAMVTVLISDDENT